MFADWLCHSSSELDWGFIRTRVGLIIVVFEIEIMELLRRYLLTFSLLLALKEEAALARALVNIAWTQSSQVVTRLLIKTV